MAWTNWKYFDFRSTLVFASDDATYGIGVVGGSPGIAGPSYPVNVTVDGDNFDYGYSTLGGNAESRNRDAGNDPRLAGIQFTPNNSSGTDQCKFKIAVPTGIYDIALALGDDDSGGQQSNMYCRVMDDTTLRVSLTGLNMTGFGYWFDATGVERTSAADWVTNGSVATVSVVINSGFIVVELGDPTSNTGTTSWGHIGIRKQSSGASLIWIKA